MQTLCSICPRETLCSQENSKYPGWVLKQLVSCSGIENSHGKSQSAIWISPPYCHQEGHPGLIQQCTRQQKPQNACTHPSAHCATSPWRRTWFAPPLEGEGLQEWGAGHSCPKATPELWLKSKWHRAPRPQKELLQHHELDPSLGLRDTNGKSPGKPSSKLVLEHWSSFASSHPASQEQVSHPS